MPLGDIKSDAELVRSLQRGNRQALGSLYDRYSRQVYRTALAITGDPDAAADILQDVFLRLLHYSKSIDPNRPVDPWLYRVTTNYCYTWIKSRRRWVHRLEDITEWFSGSENTSHSQELLVDEDWQQVQNSLSALPVAQRLVVVLYYLNDLSIDEIADVLNIPAGTVKSRLYYGREALKENLLRKAQGDTFSSLGSEFT
jgi:RNA polymerase sigma-70 factor, ECF subfamily